jgi:alpha-galactosidase
LPLPCCRRRLTRICAAFAIAAFAPALAAAADAPIVASREDAFIAHRAGSDLWAIGSQNLELTVGFDASRALTLQQLANPSVGRSWDITPGPDVVLEAGGERITLAAGGAVNLLNVEAQTTPHGVLLTFSFEVRAQRLQISRSYACYPGAPTIETWTRVAASGGEVALGGLVAWQMAAPVGRVRWLGGLRGDTAGGSVEDAFVVADRDLAPGERIELGAAGRSSEQFVPLLFVDGENDEFFGGLMWSGSWHAALDRVADRLRIVVDFPGVSTTVTPSHPVELPHAFFGVRAHGGPDESGALHQFVMRGIRHGRPFSPLVTYNTWFLYGTTVNEDAMIAEMERAAALGIELFVIDAGWYIGAGATSDYDFEAGLGTWEADPDRFPSGLASLADYAHGLGLKFGLWVEPERVALATVDKPGLAREAWLATRNGDYGGTAAAQLCLARSDARQWLLERLTALLDQVHPDYVKWDNNGWTNCNRSGHGHGPADGNMQHVQALYGLLDELRRRYPDLLIENVSGGGARIDFGMLAYTDTAWMDDRTSPARHVRHNIEGLTFAFPPAYLLSFLIDADGEPIAGATDLPLLVRSRGASVLGLTYRAELLDDETAGFLAQQIAEYKTYRDTIALANASLLTLQTPYDDRGWDALEELADDGRVALIFAFQSDFSEERVVLYPRGLLPDAVYAVRSIDVGPLGVARGDTLMQDGLELNANAVSRSHVVVIRLIEPEPAPEREP